MATRRIVALAEAAARKSEWVWLVGAVVYKGSKILAVGTNDHLRTHPKSWHEFKSRHAEFNAIIQVDRQDLKGASIYVSRLGRDGLIHNAKPCPACEKMLAWAEIRHVEWSTD